jgi:prepilin-type N-terminal cleavage/methylation domain-containing protein
MKARSNQGFSVIEMLIVLILMAIIISMGFIAMTMFKSYGRQNLRDVSRQFYRDFQLMKMTAMTQNTPTRISIIKGENEYKFYRYNIMTNSWDPCMLNTTRGPWERKFGERVEVNKDMEFAFDSSGMVVDTTDISLPVMVDFNLITQNDNLMDVHEIKIFPSGGIHVTRKMDQ